MLECALLWCDAALCVQDCTSMLLGGESLSLFSAAESMLKLYWLLW